MRALTNCYCLNAFISPKFSDIITYIDHHGKEAEYVGIDINGLYCYHQDMSVAPTTLTYIGHNYHSIDLKTNTDSG